MGPEPWNGIAGAVISEIAIYLKSYKEAVPELGQPLFYLPDWSFSQNT